jgi:Tfp pilus assembly protein PilN
MSVRINLLPDVKQAKLKASRARQLAASLCFLVIGLSLGSIVLLVIIRGAQALRINQLTNDIARSQAELESMDDLPEALTAEQHLRSLNDLYGQRAAYSKFFDVMESVAPVSEFGLEDLAYQEGTLRVGGKARTMALLDKFMKALEAANVEVGTGASRTNAPYFTEVNLQDATSDDTRRVAFTLVVTVSPEVFQKAGE